MGGRSGRAGCRRAPVVVAAAATLVVGAATVLARGAAAGPGGAPAAVPSPEPLRVPGMVDLGGCSGALARYPSSVDTDRALVLTASHCIGRPDASKRRLVDAPAAQANPVLLLDAAGGPPLALDVERAEFAGDRSAGNGPDPDIGVLRLRDTYAALRAKRDVAPLTVASPAETDRPGDGVLIASGAWAEQVRCIRGPSTVPRTGQSPSIRYTGDADHPCQGVRGGWSGSPVIGGSGSTVVGVTWGSLPSGAVVTPVTVLLRCLGPDRRVDVGLPGCLTRHVRILAMGDSLTEGMGSGTGDGYRLALRDRLVTDVDGFDYVGTRSSGSMDGNAHEGYPGWETAQVAAAARAALGAYRPNVVTLLLGTNDLVHGNDPGGAPGRLDDAVTAIQVASPRAVVLVGTLPPSTNPSVQARIGGYNAAVRAMVARRAGAGQRVGLAAMDAVTTAMLVDEVHPGDEGYGRIAAAFASAWYAADARHWLQEPEPMGAVPAVPAVAPVSCRRRAGGPGWLPQGQVAEGVPGGDMAARVRLADIDGDGRDDYLVIDEGGAVRAWINAGTGVPGGGGWRWRAEFAGGARVPPDRVRFADVDGDGLDDYVTVGPGGSLDAWRNRGGDTAGPDGMVPGLEPLGQVARGTGDDPARIILADLTGDGKDDYAVVGPGFSLKLWINQGGDRPGGAGWLAAGTVLAGAGGPGDRQAHLSDVTCDGRADLLLTDARGAVRTYVNAGAPGEAPNVAGWVDQGRTATGDGDPGVVFAQLDGDGRADYVHIGPAGQLVAYLNNGGDVP